MAPLAKPSAPKWMETDRYFHRHGVRQCGLRRMGVELGQGIRQVPPSLLRQMGTDHDERYDPGGQSPP